MKNMQSGKWIRYKLQVPECQCASSFSKVRWWKSKTLDFTIPSKVNCRLLLDECKGLCIWKEYIVSILIEFDIDLRYLQWLLFVGWKKYGWFSQNPIQKQKGIKKNRTVLLKSPYLKFLKSCHLLSNSASIPKPNMLISCK